MENATKALLIAAAILIAIVLIAVGIKVLSSTSGVTDEVGKVTEATGTAVFNSQFTDYEGTQTGTQVKALLNKVTATYRTGSSHQVTVTVLSGDGLTIGISDSSNEIATVRSNVKITSTYKIVVTDSNSDGYVDTVTISA